jgi:hypothetical protein
MEKAEPENIAPLAEQRQLNERSITQPMCYCADMAALGL